MKIKIEVRSVGEKESWFEEYDCNGDPQEFGENLILYFNSTLRPGERPREFLGYEILEEEAGPKKHDWVKVNMYTIMEGKNSHDKMKCGQCGITGKRYGLGQGGVTRDYKYRAKRYDVCRPE